MAGFGYVGTEHLLERWPSTQGRGARWVLDRPGGSIPAVRKDWRDTSGAGGAEFVLRSGYTAGHLPAVTARTFMSFTIFRVHV